MREEEMIKEMLKHTLGDRELASKVFKRLSEEVLHEELVEVHKPSDAQKGFLESLFNFQKEMSHARN